MKMCCLSSLKLILVNDLGQIKLIEQEAPAFQHYYCHRPSGRNSIVVRQATSHHPYYLLDHPPNLRFCGQTGMEKSCPGCYLRPQMEGKILRVPMPELMHFNSYSESSGLRTLSAYVKLSEQYALREVQISFRGQNQCFGFYRCQGLLEVAIVRLLLANIAILPSLCHSQEVAWVYVGVPKLAVLTGSSGGSDLSTF